MPPKIDLTALRRGDRRALAQAITLVESAREDHREQAQSVLDEVLSDAGSAGAGADGEASAEKGARPANTETNAGNAAASADGRGGIRIGITGSPGVGKSTFIEAFGLHLLGAGRRLAVLAVDPSSPIAGGSILGDKTRMEELSRREDAFIRPSPAGSAPGGVARKTRESMLLCEAAGFDTVIVETVGAGQSEYEVAGMVDCFIVLLLPNAGDELQGIKKGILELADALVINKADGEGAAAAETARGDYAAALSLLRHPAHWQPPVLACSAKEGAGIPEIWRMVGEFEAAARAAGAFQARRAKQSLDWMRALVDDFLRLKLAASAKARRLKPRLEQEVAAGKTTPRAAAQQIIDCL